MEEGTRKTCKVTAAHSCFVTQERNPVWSSRGWESKVQSAHHQTESGLNRCCSSDEAEVPWILFHN